MHPFLGEPFLRSPCTPQEVICAFFPRLLSKVGPLCIKRPAWQVLRLVLLGAETERVNGGGFFFL
jgi:hypothetical protein